MPVHECVVSVHVHMCECACVHKCEQVYGDPVEGEEVLRSLIESAQYDHLSFHQIFLHQCIQASRQELFQSW